MKVHPWSGRYSRPSDVPRSSTLRQHFRHGHSSRRSRPQPRWARFADRRDLLRSSPPLQGLGPFTAAAADFDGDGDQGLLVVQAGGPVQGCSLKSVLLTKLRRHMIAPGDPAATIVLPGVGIPATRTAKLSVPLPNDPFLKGRTIWYQGLDFVPGKPSASRLTGAGSDVMR